MVNVQDRRDARHASHMNLLERLTQLDRQLSTRLQIRRTGLLRSVLHTIAHTGDSVLWVAILIGLVLAGQSDLAARAALVVGGLALIIGALKLVFRRGRPSDENVRLYFRMDAHSFPSGHAARTAGLAVLFSAFEPALSVAAVIWVVGVSLARVWLGVHFVSDVVVGALIGVGVARVVVAL